MNEEITLKALQTAVDKWIKTYGVRYFNELTNMACLTEEVGELARVIARTYGEQSFKPGEKPNLGEEMADVLWVLVCLANQTGIDLSAEIRKSFAKKTQRDHDRHHNNTKLQRPAEQHPPPQPPPLLSGPWLPHHTPRCSVRHSHRTHRE